MDVKYGKNNSVKISGELNIYVVNELKTVFLEILSKKPKSLKVDLSDVTDIDTSCIQVLLSLKILAKKSNIDYKLVNPSSIVVEAFVLTGIMKKK